MRITVPTDSGNARDIEVTGPGAARFRLRDDNRAPFRQWFRLRCEGVAGVAVSLRLEDAASASYPKGWSGYCAVASEDGEDWFRVPTRLDGSALVIEHTPGADAVEFAYFAPYTEARRLAHCEVLRARGARLTELGPTPDGLSLPLVEVGSGALPIWVVARQHPGESMGEWFAEGLLDRLLSEDAVAARLRAAATVRVVPCVNPDGAKRGNHRTNALGVDLNRAWLSPGPAAPEVAAILRQMDATGVAFALDVHGDEEIPYNFAAGGEGTPSWDPERAALRQRFLDAWVAATPHMQTRHGYPPNGPGEANLAVCSNQITERFGCVALTVEQPFADDANHPDARTGWSPERSRALGASVVDAWSAVLDAL